LAIATVATRAGLRCRSSASGRSCSGARRATRTREVAPTTMSRR